MSFLNDHFVYQGKKLFKATWPYVKSNCQLYLERVTEMFLKLWDYSELYINGENLEQWLAYQHYSKSTSRTQRTQKNTRLS